MLNKENKSENRNKDISKRRFRSGAYSTVLAVIVIAVVLLVNLFVSELDLSLDLTAENRYTLTEETNQLAVEIKDDITIYFLVRESSQNTNTNLLEKVIKQYDNFSKINVVRKDPVLYPTFAKQYTEEEIQENDVIVVNERTKASRYISVSELLVSEIDYTTYTESYDLDAEGQITAAIQFVSNESVTKMYVVTGHNEAVVGAEFTKTLQKAGVETEELEIAKAEAIPEDCDVLLVNGPVYDFSEHDLNITKGYLENGGKAILTTQYSTEELTNYKALLNYYGVDLVDGIVFESSGNYYSYPFYLSPKTNDEHEIVKDLSDKKIFLMPESKGFSLVKDHRGSMTVESFATTSDEAYARTNIEITEMEKQEEDIAGPFHLGVAVTDTFKEYETKVVLFSGAPMLDDGFFQSGQYVNGDVFLNSVHWLTGNQTSTIVIPTRSLSETYLVVPAKPRIAIGVVTVFVIPLGLLLIGFGIWFVRRRS